MVDIKDWQRMATKNAIEHGFDWSVDEIDTVLLRIHSEVSEASEAVRDEDYEGFCKEMADIFIRLVNACEVMGVDLETEVAKKHAVNEARQSLHGRKRK